MIVTKPILSTELDHLDVVIGLLQRLQENPQNISYTETMTILKKSPKGPQKTTEELINCWGLEILGFHNFQ